MEFLFDFTLHDLPVEIDQILPSSPSVLIYPSHIVKVQYEPKGVLDSLDEDVFPKQSSGAKLAFCHGAD